MKMSSNNEMLLSEEIKSLLDSVKIKDRDKKEYIDALYALMCAYESEDNSEKASEVARDLIDKCGNDNVTEKMLRTSYDVLARGGDFEAFMMSMEWNRPLSKKFYLPRAKVFRKHGIVQSFQDLADDKLDFLIFNCPPRIGKLLADDTPILTKNGWKKHGDLMPGDEVLNDKGDFVHVLAVSPKAKTEYVVTFSNGEKIECHGNHEWVVYDRSRRENIVIETKKMVDSGLHLGNSNRFRYSVIKKSPIKGVYRELPVEPYTFGVWLGDGNNDAPVITQCFEDMKYVGARINKDGYRLRNIYRCGEEKWGRFTYDGLRNDLQKIGLCYASKRVQKYIPEVYLTASVEQRLDLLAGLIDTDGSLCKIRHRYHYTTIDITLKNSIEELIATFGWNCNTTTAIKNGHPIYVLTFNPREEIPCQIPRKQTSVVPIYQKPSIIDISPVKHPTQGNCIQVEGGIYLCGKCLTPTHNSTLSMFFLLFRAARHPEQSILGSGHSTALTQSFYREFLEMATSDEYRFDEIFPKIQLTQQNAEYTYIDFNQNKRFHTVTFKSVEGGTTGLTEASSLLYCDDLIKDAETANSKDRLDKLFESYTSTLKDRKVMRLCKDGVYRPCPELHVCTNWSIYDPTTRILNDMKQYGDMSRVRVIKVPCWDEDHESNYMYDYGKGFDVKYYEDMERVEDPVIFKAKYLCEPIERDGHPFERDALTYYTELPNETPDAIVAYNDVAHGGEDFMSMPIGYVYGRDVYIEDVLFIHNFDGDTVSRPLVCEKIISNNVSRCGFEKNNGGDFYSTLISEDLRKMGYRCNIMSYNAPTTKSKLDRILSCQNEIKGVASLDGSYRVYFKDPKLVSKNSDYMAFLTNMWSWSQKEGSIQKKQHDDSVDSISSLIINLLGKGSDSAKLKLYDIRKAGY